MWRRTIYKRCLATIESRPRTVFAAMVCILVVSLALMLTVFRPNQPSRLPESPALTGGLANGLGGMADGALALTELLALQAEVQALLDKESLDALDSLSLEAAITRLEAVQRRLAPVAQVTDSTLMDNNWNNE